MEQCLILFLQMKEYPMAFKKLETKDLYYIPGSPKFPGFPELEWRGRIDKAKSLLKKEGIDALVLFTQSDIRYFFGFETGHWIIPDLQCAIGIILADDEPQLVVADFLSGNAQAFGWCKHIWLLSSTHEVNAQRQVVIDLATILKELGCEKKNIALETGKMGYLVIPRTAEDQASFKRQLPLANFVDGEEIIWSCRMIKSPLEIERIKQATRVVNQMHLAAIRGFRPGMSEIDIEKIYRHVEVDSGDFQGADNTMMAAVLCGAAKEKILDVLAIEGVSALRPNDVLGLDLQHRHKGYWSDIGRVFQAGIVTDRDRKNYNIIESGIKAAEAVLKAGVKAKDVFNAAIKPLLDANAMPAVEMVGHGIGLDIHEPPSLDGQNDMVLQEGMTIAIEIWLFDEGWRSLGGGGIYGFEDIYVVGRDGFELIQGLDHQIIQVDHPIT